MHAFLLACTKHPLTYVCVLVFFTGRSRGHLATHLVEAALMEAGGQRVGGPARAAAGNSNGAWSRSLGAAHVHQWELLWSKSSYAIKAARQLRWVCLEFRGSCSGFISL